MICKRHKRKCSERLGDKDIGNLAVLHEVLSQFVSSHVLCAAANKDLTIVGTRLQTKQKRETIWRCGTLAFLILLPNL